MPRFGISSSSRVLEQKTRHLVKHKMDISAAVARTPGGPLYLETLQLDEPHDDEVVVRVVAAGVCHTDIVVRDQVLPTPLPLVLGHEGSGIVERVGRAVRALSPGDAVVMSFDSCGTCRSCHEAAPAYCYRFRALNFAGSRQDGTTGLSCNGERIHGHFFGQSSFATHALCRERSLVKVPRDVPLELLGPLACGIQTGAGAVLNALRVRPGNSLVVFGVGSVGLAAILAARAAGATCIIAVDRNRSRLQLAHELGATHILDAALPSIDAAVIDLTQGGADFSFDTTGLPTVIKTAVLSLAPRGLCGIVGASAPGTDIKLDEVHFMSGGRRLMGIVEGSAVPANFIPKMLAMHRAGLFPFDRLVRFYPFNQINQAIRDSELGTVIKAVVTM